MQDTLRQLCTNFLAAGAEDEAALLVEKQQAELLITNPRAARLLFDLLPDSATRENVRLLLDRSFIAVVNAEKDVASVVRRAGEAIDRMKEMQTECELVSAEWSVLRGVVDFRDRNLEGMQRRLLESEPYLDALSNHIVGIYWFLHMHLKHQLGQHESALRSGDQVLAAFTRAGFDRGVIAVQREMAMWCTRLGDSTEASRISEALFENYRNIVSYSSRDVMTAYIVAAENAYLRDELPQALSYLRDALRLAEEKRDDELIYALKVIELGYEAVLDGTTDNRIQMEDVSERFVTLGLLEPFLEAETRRLVITGHGDEAWPLIQRFGLEFSEVPDAYGFDAFVPYLRAYIARNRSLSRIDTLLREAIDFCDEHGLRLRQLQLLTLSAWHSLLLYGPSFAAEPLLCAKRLACETGYARVILDIPALANRMEVRGTVTSRLDGNGLLPGNIQLTPNEIRVLELLEADLTYDEIARELSVSINTIRFHVRNTYGKLSVHRRVSAVSRARQLGLLADRSISN